MTINIDQLVEQTSKMKDDNAVYQLLLEHYTSLYWEAKNTMQSTLKDFSYDIDGSLIIPTDQFDEYLELKRKLFTICSDLKDVETLMDYERYTFTPAVPCSGGGQVRYRRVFNDDGSFREFRQQRKDAIGLYQESKLGVETFWQEVPGMGAQYLAACLNKLIEDCID